ncbi:MAG: HAMP domain-containing sensor histidine kinase [bacterium]
MARRAMAGVKEVTKAAEQIATGHFDDRVNVTGYGEEIELLGATFNRMAEKIQILLREMSQVNNSIAHDLRSPITRIRIFSESIAAEKNVSPKCEEATAGIAENCDRLANMIDTMLNIAEVEAGVTRMNIEEVDLEPVVSEAQDLFQPVAEEKGIEWHCEIHSAPAVRGDRRKIQRCLANLIDNALKYTNPGGEVVVTLEPENGDFVTIAVRDNGIGITGQERSKIFESFYRGDQSRSQPGNGLGLSLALAVARSLGGDITVDSAPSKGSTFNLILPASTPTEHTPASPPST